MWNNKCSILYKFMRGNTMMQLLISLTFVLIAVKALKAVIYFSVSALIILFLLIFLIH